MESTSVIAVLATLLIWTATADNPSPTLSPIIDDVCKNKECGKGTCKPSPDSPPFFFVCECDPGWNQTQTFLDQNLSFLPCVIPNCSIDLSCSQAPPPVQDKGHKANISIFDPCHWVDCGGGSCNKTSLFTYTCGCNQGYNNLLNITALPCFNQCSLGLDCSNLGITVQNRSTSSPPTVVANNANSTSWGILHWLVSMVIVLAPFMSKWN